MENKVLNQLISSLIRHQSFIRKASYNQTLHFAVIRLVGLIRGNSILNGIIEELESQVQDVKAVKSVAHNIMAEKGAPDFKDEKAFVFCSLYVLELCTKADVGAEFQAAKARCLNPGNHLEELETFFTVYTEPVVTYLVDQLNNMQYVVSHLIRYKQRVEWFEIEEIKERIDKFGKKDKDHKRKIESLLNSRLYRYLHDQGVEFYIEPSSAQARGEVDLISAQGEAPQLLLDGKYLEDSSSLKSYTAAAFGQVYHYTQQYNRSSGYIVLFKNIEEEVRFNFPNIDLGVNYIDLNNKRVYFILVNIMYYSKSTSQRGKPKVIDINESDLISVVAQSS